MGFGWQEIDKTLDLGYIRVAGLHRECKPAVLFDPPNFYPRTMTHVCIFIHMYVRTYVRMQACVLFHPVAMISRVSFLLMSRASYSKYQQ